jgi:hypothetical protein
MDQKLFEQKLSEVADWKIPESLQETSANAKKKRGRKSEEELYQEAHEEIFMEIHGGVNPTITPMLTNVKCQPVDCEDCGQHCPNGRHTEKEYYRTNHGHWRERCRTCNKHKNPYTGDFDMSAQASPAIWTAYLKGSKKPAALRKILAEIEAKYNTKIIETETGYIKIYPEKSEQDK